MCACVYACVYACNHLTHVDLFISANVFILSFVKQSNKQTSPIFSGLFLQIKAGKVDLDERILVDKFVKVTKLNRDDVHFIRALAMKGEVNARLGHYKSALSASALLASAYDAETHHESICKAYGSDRAAQGMLLLTLGCDTS